MLNAYRTVKGAAVLLVGTAICALFAPSLAPGDDEIPKSPLFGATDFSQQMLRMEEFGSEPLDPGAQLPVFAFPKPTAGPAPEQDPNNVARSGPSGPALDAFLGQEGIAPFPTRLANITDQNPWRFEIERFLSRPLVTAPAEGRPPGEGWSHQRYDEFFPRVFLITAQDGARVNSGVRDTRQRHRYAVGEFGPGGLYHNTAGIPATEGTTRGIEVRFHPNFPVQNHNSVWTFDGTFPPKLIVARYGQPILLRHYNALPMTRRQTAASDCIP